MCVCPLCVYCRGVHESLLELHSLNAIALHQALSRMQLLASDICRDGIRRPILVSVRNVACVENQKRNHGQF